MKFKNWKEQYKFIEEYATASCINCRYGGNKGDSDDDGMYKRIFCRKFISMVEFAFQFVCAEWEDDDGNDMSQFDEDTPLFQIDDDLLESLDTDYEWTLDEIKERINSYEEVKE